MKNNPYGISYPRLIILLKKIINVSTLVDAKSCNKLGDIYSHVVKNEVNEEMYYMESCSLDNAVGGRNLAFLYEPQTKNENNLKYHIYLSKACDLNDGRSCEYLAKEYSDGKSKDLAKSFELYQKACSLKNRRACSKLGTYYVEELGVNKNIEKGIELYTQSCEANDSKGCLELGKLYYTDAVIPYDYKKSFSYLKKSCSHANGMGCYLAAIQLTFRFGVEPSAEESESNYYEKACTFGVGSACLTIAKMYENGTNEVLESQEKASKFYELGCIHGAGDGCFIYGYKLNKGIGVKNDYKEYLKYYKIGCDKNNAASCTALVAYYIVDSSLNIDFQTVNELYEKACSLDEPVACGQL